MNNAEAMFWSENFLSIEIFYTSIVYMGYNAKRCMKISLRVNDLIRVLHAILWLKCRKPKWSLKASFNCKPKKERRKPSIWQIADMLTFNSIRWLIGKFSEKKLYTHKKIFIRAYSLQNTIRQSLSHLDYLHTSPRLSNRFK